MASIVKWVISFGLYCMVNVQFSSVAQSCPTLCDPMDCSMPGLPVHHQLPEFTQGSTHARARRLQKLWCSGLVTLWLLESSWIRDRTCVPCIGKRILTHCTTREVPGVLFSWWSSGLVGRIWPEGKRECGLSQVVGAVERFELVVWTSDVLILKFSVFTP